MRTILYFFLFFLASKTEGQENIIPKHQILFDFGGHYNYIFGDRYIASYTGPSFPGALTQQYVGYTEMPSFGIHTGLFYDYIYKNKFVVEAGLLYNNRRLIYKTDCTTVTFDGVIYNLDINKYDISPNNIEAEINFGCRYKKFIFCFGTKYFLWELEKQTLIYVNGNKQIKKENKFYDPRYGFFDRFTPEIKVCYTLNISKKIIIIYLLANKQYFSYKNYLFGCCVKIPIIPSLINFNKNN